MTSTPLSGLSGLLLAVVTVLVAWQLPYGPQALYPLSLLATFAHEMGHGLTAIVVGGEFDHLLLHADGSGLATWRGDPGRLARAAIAAGGLLGPSIAGVSLLVFARSPRVARMLLVVLAAGLALCVLAWVRNLFGMAFLLGMAATLAAAARWLGDAAAAFVLRLLTAVLCLSWFRDLGYMFSAQVVVAGTVHRSDSGVIADALWLPYWFWGALVAALSLALLVFGLWAVARPRRGDAA